MINYTLPPANNDFTAVFDDSPNSLPGLKEGDIENGQVYECGDTPHCP